MPTEAPFWTLTGSTDDDVKEIKIRRLVGAKARTAIPEILEVLTAFANSDDGVRFISTLVELGRRDAENNQATLIEELPLIVNQFTGILKPILTYFEQNALPILTTVTPEILEEYGTFPEVCLIMYQALVYHYQTSMTPQVQEALKKFSNALSTQTQETDQSVLVETA